jgi:hypothetical protein
MMGGGLPYEEQCNLNTEKWTEITKLSMIGSRAVILLFLLTEQD